jgi:hypothetical protein
MSIEIQGENQGIPIGVNASRIEHPPILWTQSQRILKKIAKKVDGPVIAYFTSSDSRIDTDDVKYFYSHLKKIGHQEKIFFVLVSHGGSGEGAWRIASLLRSFCEELILLLPEVAASAATILSLSADAIYMTPLAYLSAVDTSIYHPLNPKNNENKPIHMELDEVNRSVEALLQQRKNPSDAYEVYKTIFEYIHPVAFGAVARSTTLSEMLCGDIMDLRKIKPNPQIKKKLIESLNTGYPSHSYPITRHKAQELGLQIEYPDKELNDLLWSLLSTYVQVTRPLRSYLSQTVVHTESVNTIIESTQLRFSLHHSMQKRLDQILKNWLTFKDDYEWNSVFVKKNDGKQIIQHAKIEF